MKLHEKTLELNITHELLNLADSWYWFLADIPLWRYWRPRHRLPFLKCPKSTASGFHITTEGKSDPTGEAGGGYDVRIKSGIGGHLLFLQYKAGDFVQTSPSPKSIFNNQPFEHYKFKINSTTTNQHFLLRDLEKGVGSKRGNAVVYAFPLIADMKELEKYSGKLVRRTKFISITDIDAQANANQVSFTRNLEHNFRICASDMSRCEVNFFFFMYQGIDRASEIITDIIALRFQKTLSYYISAIQSNYVEYNLNTEYIGAGLERAFGQYLRYLLHYFEVAPGTNELLMPTFNEYVAEYPQDEFAGYENAPRDIEIVRSIFRALSSYIDFIKNPMIEKVEGKIIINRELPTYQPSFLKPLNEGGLELRFYADTPAEGIENISYLIV